MREQKRTDWSTKKGQGMLRGKWPRSNTRHMWSFMIGYTQRKEKKICTGWQDREITGKDLQRVRLIKYRDGNIITSDDGVLRRCK